MQPGAESRPGPRTVLLMPIVCVLADLMMLC